MEDEILDLMIELEEVEANQAEIKQDLEDYQLKLNKLQKSYKEEQSELSIELEEVKQKKESLSEAIGDDLMAEYQKLKEKSMVWQ